MIALFDSSSLISFVRYYLPFDNGGFIDKFLENKISEEQIVIIDEIYSECRRFDAGLVYDSFSSFQKKSYKSGIFPYNTKDLIPGSNIFYNMIIKDFLNSELPIIKEIQTPEGPKNNTELVKISDLTQRELESLKKQFLTSTDGKLIILADNLKDKEEIVVVTEEKERSNDSKAFKKIPAICKLLGITCISLPVYLEKYSNLNIEIR
ncbi:MAG: DUF4411 family protein [Ignavibacteriaceae bacterium]|nr:DUF4411 family protein [Ignavibacteriaceae bacterium]